MYICNQSHSHCKLESEIIQELGKNMKYVGTLEIRLQQNKPQ